MSLVHSPIRYALRDASASAFDRRPGGAAAFDPATLFSSGEQGWWYDLSDISTLFQDSARTVPVTAAGQSVGGITDKSGRGNHMTASGAKRPIYRVDGSGFPYLESDGINHWMSTAAGVNWASSDKLFASFAVRVEGAGNQAIFSNDSVGTSRFNLLYLSGASPRPRGSLSTAGGDTQITVDPKSAAPYSVVNSLKLDAAGGSSAARVVVRQDGVAPTQTVASAGASGAAFSSQQLALMGSSASVAQFLFQGRFYGSIGRGVSTPDATIRQVEDYLAAKMGLFF